MDADYGLPSSSYLPPGSSNSSAQPILPAGGGVECSPGLWQAVYRVSATVTNTGEVAGSEVAQVYVALGNGEPSKVLRGFDKNFVEPGESKQFSVDLLRRDLSIWDTDAQDWTMVEEVTVFVGPSSSMLPLSQVLKLGLSSAVSIVRIL